MILPDTPVEIEGVARHYDEVDEFYREVWGEHVHHGLWISGRETPEEAVKQLVHMVAKRARVKRGMRICDVGCGYGGTSRMLVSDYHATVTGLTVSKAQFQYADALSLENGNPRFLLCPWEENSFAADSFDAVVSIECISHVRDKPEFYRQLQRVLRPGGKAVVIAWLANPRSGSIAKRHLLVPICTEGRLPGMATAAEYNDMIVAAGLSLTGYQELGPKVRKTWWICIRRMIWKILTNKKYGKALLDADKSNRVFAVTLLRILVAYYTRSMQYGVFEISKCGGGDSDINDR